MKYVLTNKQKVDGLIKTLKADKYDLWRALIRSFRGGKGADINSEKREWVGRGLNIMVFYIIAYLRRQ